MRNKLLHCFSAPSRVLVHGVAIAAVASLALMFPAGASSVQKGEKLLQHAVEIAPKLPALRRGGEFWHTDRNRVLDAHNREIRIAGVNWSGFETRRAVPGGLTVQDYRTILHTIRAQGYNTVRLPLSNEMIESPTVPSDIAYTANGEAINGDLDGLNSLQILDKIVAAAGTAGLKVILDNHRSEAGDSAEPNGLWFTPEYPEAAWIADWVMLAKRFRNDATVIGMDLRNEPHNAATTGACWDCGGDRDWHLAAERAGNAVLHENPQLLIFVEGVDTYAGESSWWGGNLIGVRRSPVRLALPNRLVYSAHVYGPVEYKQAWFNESTSAASLRAVWRRQWAYISEGGIAPVWIGEFGTPNTDADVRSADPGSEGQWFSELVRFLHEEPSLQWTYWDINGEDRYGLLDTRYGTQPVNALKAEVLASILPGHLDPRGASAPVPDAARASQPVTVMPVAVSPSVAPGPPPAAFDPYAAAAREEVERNLFSSEGAKLTPEPREPRPALRQLPPPAAAPGPETHVKTAVANDVQQAIAAAMQAAPVPKSR